MGFNISNFGDSQILLFRILIAKKSLKMSCIGWTRKVLHIKWRVAREETCQTPHYEYCIYIYNKIQVDGKMVGSQNWRTLRCHTLTSFQSISRLSPKGHTTVSISFPTSSTCFPCHFLYQISQISDPIYHPVPQGICFFVKVMARTLSLLTTPGHRRFFRLASASITGQSNNLLYSGYHLTPHDLTQPGGV